jgi:diacylglycerol kinase family enzyme/predicted HAD superfamily phosphohydrolase YqeG
VSSPSSSRRWLARLSLLLALAAIVVLIVFAELHSIGIFGVALASAAVSLASAFTFLATRRLRRWLAAAALVASPAAALAIFAWWGVLWVAATSAACWLLSGTAARAALAPAGWRMPEHPPQRSARHPFLIMNPRSGGGKVAKFGLQAKAERLGAEVFLMTGPDPVDVPGVASDAVARGADLLGVAGGDGTQALVADVAARCGVPFVVITAGTRNHFAMDLGLDRDNPASCLDALTDGVDIVVDLGTVGTRTFVNNASFGAYAAVVQSPAYRDDKIGATLDQLPDLLSGARAAPLEVRAGDVALHGPQAVLVGNNPYETSDIAGLNRRARLDTGSLGVVSVSVANARQAAGLIRGSGSGLKVLTAAEVVVDAAAEQIPVGVDGEAVLMPPPVRCSTRPGALVVRVPRERPGVPAPRGRVTWARLRQLAAPRPRASLRRAGYQQVSDEREIAGWIAELSARTAIFDVEPLIAGWNSSQQTLDSGIARLAGELRAIRGLDVVCFATNSARRPSALPATAGIIYLASARKPLRTGPFLDLPRPGVVVGDQVLTDGLLARRLGYTFLHYQPKTGSMPPGPAVLYRLGMLLRPAFLRSGRP